MLLNRTFDDFRRGIEGQDLGAMLRDLLGYASFRFATEERFMSEHGYHDWGPSRGACALCPEGR